MTSGARSSSTSSCASGAHSGYLHAADQAWARGLRRVTSVELGVGGGTGFLNMCEIARRVTAETSVEFDLVGFRRNSGMPAPTDHRDHPSSIAKDGSRWIATA